MPRLNPGDPFPKLTLSTTDGQMTTVPDAFACDFGKDPSRGGSPERRFS
jgi:hypothetical protein